MRVMIGFGGNVGDVHATITSALAEIQSLPMTALLEVSSLYRTKAWGGVAEGDFINGVCAIETNLSAYELLDALLEIEHKLGRTREQHWGNRTIDLDILTYGDEMYNDDRLKIPHPYIQDRAFVLVPLCEISEDEHYIEALEMLPVHEYMAVEKLPSR